MAVPADLTEELHPFEYSFLDWLLDRVGDSDSDCVTSADFRLEYCLTEAALREALRSLCRRGYIEIDSDEPPERDPLSVERLPEVRLTGRGMSTARRFRDVRSDVVRVGSVLLKWCYGNPGKPLRELFHEEVSLLGYTLQEGSVLDAMRLLAGRRLIHAPELTELDLDHRVSLTERGIQCAQSGANVSDFPAPEESSASPRKIINITNSNVAMDQAQVTALIQNVREARAQPDLSSGELAALLREVEEAVADVRAGGQGAGMGRLQRVLERLKEALDAAPETVGRQVALAGVAATLNGIMG